MTQQDTQNPDVFAMDKWLIRLGLWDGDTPMGDIPAKARKKAFKMQASDLSKPIIFSHSDSDPTGKQMASILSRTSIDIKNGIFEDQIIYWRHAPETNLLGNAPHIEDQHVLTIKGLVTTSPEKQKDVPIILPQEIWVNGQRILHIDAQSDQAKTLFDGHNRRLINWAVDTSQQIKHSLRDKRPLHEIAALLQQGNLPLSQQFSQGITGNSLRLKGLNPDGWDETESALHAYFSHVLSQGSGGFAPIAFTLAPLKQIAPDTRLKSVMSYTLNSRETMRAMGQGKGAVAVSPAGAAFKTNSYHTYDAANKTHHFYLNVQGDDPIDDMKTPPDMHIAHVAFKHTPRTHQYHLTTAEFLGQNILSLHDRHAQYSVINFMQQANRYLSEGKYPPYQDLARLYHLDEFVKEMNPPPHIDDSFQTVWIPTFGTSFEKRLDDMGDGIGGGNVIMNRCMNAAGKLDEIAVLQGLPIQPAGSNSDYDGLQPDILAPALKSPIQKGLILLDHIHFDHSTIEYFTKMKDQHGKGFMEGQKIMLKEYDYEIVRKHLKTLSIPPSQWPEFIVYDRKNERDRHDNLYKFTDDHFAYRLQDDNGNTRFWVQICKNGSAHSAPTDQSMITSCFNDQFGDTYAIDNDAFGNTPHGRQFFKDGQLALAKFLPDQVKKEDLLKAVPSKNKLYISLEEATSLDQMGEAPTNQDIQNNWQRLMKMMPANKAVTVAPFSTNHAELEIIFNVWNESDTQRNFTAVGANMEARLAAMNKCGLDLDTDLTAIILDKKHLPTEIFDAGLQALKDYKTDLEDKTQAKAEKKKKRKKSIAAETKAMLGNSPHYQMIKKIVQKAEQQITKGDDRPKILHDLFFSGDVGAFKAKAIKWGITTEHDSFEAPNVVMKALEDLKESRANDVDDPDADTLLWMVKSILRSQGTLKKEHNTNHCGHVHFTGKSKVNETLMLKAILADQETASRFATRGAKTVKDQWLSDLGKFGSVTTGPIGAIGDNEASLPRFRRGTSIYDGDPTVRSTALRIPAQDTVFIVPQTPSMGSEAKIAQDNLLKTLAKQRNVMIIHAYKNGIRIINPQDQRNHFINALKQQGLSVQDDPESGGLYVPDFPIHRNGHRFYQDMVQKQSDPDFKAKAVEAIHIASPTCYERLKDAVAQGGRQVSIRRPDDWIMREYQYNPKTKQGEMQDVAYLNPRYKAVRLTSPYGQQYNWQVEMISHIFTRRDGTGHNDGLCVRHMNSSDIQQPSPRILSPANDWVKASQGQSSHAQNKAGPSIADIQETGGQPLIGMPEYMIK